ncbi:pantoate kinase [Halococcoides cellulosivorans]|uniref:Pantoate kinase n=1 Tax=Halococcoides cellulosivorans TaxID=1679096 RepID=A0A2R4X2D6_9EURY|nr:sugar kinase [Halococcoides cellulosivorans]AWB27951.1 sugar kinase [Halococcoides cellulosivorans]
MTVRARAFVPGHVTGFFTVERGPDPAHTGSRGAGLALASGVTVAVREASGPITLDGEPIDIAAAEQVRQALGLDRAVAVATDLPLGAGFGVSGAVALGTALAGAAALDCPRPRSELVGLAHRAEVAAGTGLGDVVAQATGGLVVRTAAGEPSIGRVDAIPVAGSVEVFSRGERSTADIVGGETDRLSAAGERALATLLDDPRPATFYRASRRFGTAAGLDHPVADVLADVERAGGTAIVAMLGETVISPDGGLSAAGYDVRRVQIDPAGAALREVPDDRDGA